jgi:hypothetical protein
MSDDEIKNAKEFDVAVVEAKKLLVEALRKDKDADVDLDTFLKVDEPQKYRESVDFYPTVEEGPCSLHENLDVVWHPDFENCEEKVVFDFILKHVQELAEMTKAQHKKVLEELTKRFEREKNDEDSLTAKFRQELFNEN